MLGCNKHPRFRTAALLMLGQGFGWDAIQQYMCQHYPDAVLLYHTLTNTEKGYFPTIPIYDPFKAVLPPYTQESLSVCLCRIICQTETKRNKRRADILTEISVYGQCSLSCVKKLLAGYCDWPKQSQTHLEPPWPVLLSCAKVCGCSRLDFDYLLSVAFPDLALAFWLRPSYSPDEGYTAAAMEIDRHIKRCKYACSRSKGLVNCDECKHCSMPKIELTVRARK